MQRVRGVLHVLIRLGRQRLLKDDAQSFGIFLRRGIFLKRAFAC